MARRAKILLAGTLIATGLYGAATSQTVINEQVQLGDIFAEQDIDVVEVEEGVQQTTSANGNTLMGSVEGADLDIVSNQTMSGGSLARTDLTVSETLGESSTISTAAVGNSGDASIVEGTMTGVFNQLNNGDGQTARSWIEAGAATAGDITSNTQAVGNSQGLGLTNGAVGARFAQENEASASAEAGAVLLYTPGYSTVTTTAAGNNASSVGVDQSAQRLDISQNNIGASVNARSQGYYGNSYITTTSATASGNNVNVTNEGPLLDVTTTQSNEAAIAAESYETSYDFGAASSLAYGVGNSVMAGNAGTEIALDNTQNNDGAVVSVSSFGGNAGYDALTSATAMGNAVTGYACAYCDGTMTVRNQQTNGSSVSAQSSMTLTGSARSVIGLTTAVGNNASFYVSHPSE